ncbi:hypothetical protein [Motilimonas cestriensis]|uniref:hypothetical protein n=1 Tax=Motilimonas cestriensis TaxID=2742685 RepID=UPI001E59C2C0|nr:hypothetical protein [Motilimonas cestriensis]
MTSFKFRRVLFISFYAKQGYKTAVGIGLSKFFDEVNHDLLINRIGRKIKNKALMRLLPDYVAIQLFTFT